MRRSEGLQPTCGSAGSGGAGAGNGGGALLVVVVSTATQNGAVPWKGGPLVWAP